MKIAILSESPADEEAISILVSAILGVPFERPKLPSLRARGWSQIVPGLPRVIKSLHYNSDAEGLVIVVDSNGKSMHSDAHNTNGGEDPDCRFCSIRSTAQRELARLSARPRTPALRFAVGLAVPALEAWLLSHAKAGMTEANWRMARQEGREPHSRQELKEMLYGTTTPSLELETRKMMENMSDIIKDLPRLSTAFPGGFTPLFDEIRSWK